jgi:NAD(P)-dependent dehydrogenase (short-subunit alcohol dehydrogenase family)
MSVAASKIALVTGANKGIGREVARQLAARGFRVFLGARRPDAGRQAAAELAAAGAVEFLEIDVADGANIARAAQELAGRVPHLDVLVNNAGILGDGKATVAEIDAGLVRRTFETNALGPLLVTQALLPLLLKAPAGARIVNVSSGAGALHDMTTWAPAYSISKTALNAVTRQFAAALRTHHVAVNSACPGWVRTDMGGAGATRPVEQGADTIVWLATEAPASLTGKFVRDRKTIEW